MTRWWSLSRAGANLFRRAAVGGKRFWFSAGIATGIDGIVKTDESTSTSFTFEKRTLQHPFLIKQATTDTVVACSQLLTVVAAAFQDISHRIRELISEEICLMRQNIDIGGILEENNDEIIALRGTIGDLKRDLQSLICYLEYAEKLATNAAEISHFSGNTVVSEVIFQQIQHIKKYYDDEIKLNEALEMEYIRWQTLAVESSMRNEILEEEKNS